MIVFVLWKVYQSLYLGVTVVICLLHMTWFISLQHSQKERENCWNCQNDCVCSAEGLSELVSSSYSSLISPTYDSLHNSQKERVIVVIVCLLHMSEIKER